MIELIDGSKNYVSLLQQGVHLNCVNSALASLVTPPRRQTKKRMSVPMTTPMRSPTPPNSKKVPVENLSRSLPKQGSVDRTSPSRLSPSQLGKGLYAGAKFGERPLPAELPSPPNHWVSNKNLVFDSKEQSCIEMTNTLKVLLKVQS